MKDTKSSSVKQDGATLSTNGTDNTDFQPRTKEAVHLKNSETREIPAQSAMDNATDAKVDAEAERTVKIAELENKVADYLDRLMRSQAELQNYKKRTDREIAQIRNYATERFAIELLAIKDSLEMGLQSDADADIKKLREGIGLTLKLLQQVFEKFDIKEINPEGETFNPEFHQAMMTQADTTQPPNTVLKVLQKGYLMNDRLLRAAMVCVSGTPATPVSDEVALSEESTLPQQEKENTEKNENMGKTANRKAD